MYVVVTIDIYGCVFIVAMCEKCMKHLISNRHEIYNYCKHVVKEV